MVRLAARRLLARVVPPARYECPCGSYALVVPYGTPSVVIDAHLGQHYVECPVAQADVILRTAHD